MSNEMLNNNFQNIIINFVKKNFKYLIVLLIFLVLILFSFLFYKEVQIKNEIKLSEQYIQASIQFKQKNLDETKKLLENIINEKHKFYSTIALYFIIDNSLETDSLKIINYFDKVLSISSIDNENLNLIKIKKAFFLFNTGDEKLIIKTLNPIINSDSVWKNMAIELISDYYLSKNQNIKSNEYLKILNKRKKN